MSETRSSKYNTLTDNLKVLGGFMALSVILRFFSFFPSLISHDEGTYFVISRELFLGEIYFADIIDTKPIGIFIILGLFIKYISSSIFMIRLFAAIIIACTAFTLYKISLYDQGERKPAIAAGVIFIFFVSVYTHFGVFVNPELFYTFFTAIGFYVFIRTEKPSGYLLTGIFMGTGFILKYVVLFDMAAWLMFVFAMAVYKKDWLNTRRIFLKCLAACFGFLLPFMLLTGYYFIIGHLKEFMFYTFGVTSRIPSDSSLIEILVNVGDFHLRFLPVLFFFYFALIKSIKKNINHRIPDGLIITWCVMVLIAILLPGKPFGHYFIQIMIPISLVAGRFFREELIKPLWLSRIIAHPTGTIILAVAIAANVLMQKHDYFNKPDLPPRVAEYLAPRLEREDRIFTGNYQPVLYYLLNMNCPVRYVHRTLVCDPGHRQSLQIDLAKEMDAILKQDFKYILMTKPHCYEPLNVYLRNHYRMINKFEGDVYIYERKLP